MNYLYVKLNPAGESADGVEAWKLINKNGCFLYILFTCGNAFYPNSDVSSGVSAAVPGKAGSNGGCCRTVTVQEDVSTVPSSADSVSRTAVLRLNRYRAS